MKNIYMSRGPKVKQLLYRTIGNSYNYKPFNWCEDPIWHTITNTRIVAIQLIINIVI